jgi:hypothetical protein
MLVALASCALLSSAGCTHYAERNTLPPLSITLPQGSTGASFERLVRLTRALGYSVDFADVRYGVIGTHTRAQLTRRGGAATIVVQCFGDGRATVTLLGGTPLDAGMRVRVPEGMRREVVAFTQALESGVAP